MVLLEWLTRQSGQCSRRKPRSRRSPKQQRLAASNRRLPANDSPRLGQIPHGRCITCLFPLHSSSLENQEVEQAKKADLPRHTSKHNHHHDTVRGVHAWDTNKASQQAFHGHPRDTEACSFCRVDGVGRMIVAGVGGAVWGTFLITP